MRTVIFSIPMRPIGKERPQWTGTRMITRPATRKAEETIAWHAKAAMAGEAPLEGPVIMDIHCIMPMAKSWSRKKRSAHDGKPHIQKPDASNVIKLVEDALNGIAYHDDAQVWAGSFRMMWGCEGSVCVTLMESGSCA